MDKVFDRLKEASSWLGLAIVSFMIGFEPINLPESLDGAFGFTAAEWRGVFVFFTFVFCILGIAIKEGRPTKISNVRVYDPKNDLGNTNDRP